MYNLLLLVHLLVKYVFCLKITFDTHVEFKITLLDFNSNTFLQYDITFTFTKVKILTQYWDFLQ